MVTNTRQFGDLNEDGMLDDADIDLIAAAIRSGQGGVDLDGDGAVSQTDHAFLVSEIFHIDYGDSNLDGVFDSRDIVLVFQAAEYEDTIIDNSTWAEGDWNGDGEFSTSDLVFAFQTGKYI
jgi:hypothetical protein